MPFNGSGTFNRLHSWATDAANNVNISSSEMDAEDNGFASGLTNCITRDGQSPPTANIPWGGLRLTNLGAATADTDALNRITADGRYTTLTATDARYLQLSGGTLTGSLNLGGPLTAPTPNSGTSGGVRVAANGTTNNAIIQFINAALTLELANLLVDNSGNATLTATTFSVTGTLKQGSNAVWHAGNLTASALNGIYGFTPANSASVAPLASPGFTGTPTAPTASFGTSTTQLATTAFVQGAKAANIQAITSAATITPAYPNDLVTVSALAVAATIANPTGSPTDGWGMVLRIKDNGTARALTWGTAYRAIGTALPSTTVISKNLYVAMLWNATDSFWDVVSVAEQ